jgi:RNA polymerase sigma-70 factor (ECF subfamily)
MNDSNCLAEQFEENREYLRGVAYRMLGSIAEADDAVQDCWLRLSRANSDEFSNFRGWLTTVLARICLDTLRSRKVKREDPLEAVATEPVTRQRRPVDPEAEAILADSVGHAILVVLQRLNPIERVAFVLHDLFGIPFEEIAGITGRSSEAIRQVASRARRRIRGVTTLDEDELDQQLSLVERFLEGLRRGDVNVLLEVLDPDAAVRADGAAGVGKGGLEIRGAEAWTKKAVEAARGAGLARIALVDGSVGLIMAPRGRLVKVLRFSFVKGRIGAMEVIGEPQRLKEIEIGTLDIDAKDVSELSKFCRSQ